ncbi:MAG: hypothetical protein R3F02_13745 [Thiolinea sp.]
MIETGLLAGQVGSALQQNPQSLPAANAKDSERFQDLISGGKNTDTSIQPQPLDNSVLQFVEPGQQADTTTLTDRMIDHASRIDGNYHSLLEQMGNRPGFDEYLNNKYKDNASAEMLTYPAVNVDDGTGNSILETSVKNMETSQKATLEYQNDLHKWSMNFHIWSSGVELVATAAQKVSTAFTTLFRASG